MQYLYPAIFENAEEGGYIVNFPDIPNCFTCGDTMIEAIEMAQDVLAMMLADYEDCGKEVPIPSDAKKIETKGMVNLVFTDTEMWRRTVDNKAVKKTLTLPSWLNKKAEKSGINFSQTLQEALCNKMGITL